jgi:hypothetical protein
MEIPGQQTIELKMRQFQIDIGYGFNILLEKILTRGEKM